MKNIEGKEYFIKKSSKKKLPEIFLKRFFFSYIKKEFIYLENDKFFVTGLKIQIKILSEPILVNFSSCLHGLSKLKVYLFIVLIYIKFIYTISRYESMSR